MNESWADWIKNEIFVNWDKHRTERFDEVRGQMSDVILAGQASGGRYYGDLHLRMTTSNNIRLEALLTPVVGRRV